MELAVVAAEIFAETVEAMQILAVLRGVPAGNQHPLFLLGMKPVAGISGVGGINGFGGDQEALLFASLPVVHQMAVTTGAFVAEIAGVHTFALGDERRAVRGIYPVAIYGFLAAIPNAEDDAAFRGAVDLHAEVTAVPAAGFKIGPQGRLHAGDFAVESVNVRDAGRGIGEMHGSGVAAFLEIEMCTRGGRAIQGKRFNPASSGALVIQGFQGDGLVAGGSDGEGPKVDVGGRVARPGDGGLMGGASHGEAELAGLAGRQMELHGAGEVAGVFELAKPPHLLRRIIPAGDAAVPGDPGAPIGRFEIGGEGGHGQRRAGVNQSAQQKGEDKFRFHFKILSSCGWGTEAA